MKPVRKKMPSQMVPLVTVKRKAWARPGKESCTAPICIMPRLSMRSPMLAQATMQRIMTSVLIRSLCSLDILRGLVVSGSRRKFRHGDHGFFDVAALADPLPALGAQLHEAGGFVVEALALVAVPEGFADDAPDDARAEIILVVEAIDAFHHVGFGEVRVFDVGKLVATVVGEGFHFEETFLGHGVVKFGARHGMGERNLDGFAVEFLGEIDGVVDGLLGFAGEANDEIAVDFNAYLLAILHELAGHLGGGALFDVLEDLGVARFEAHNEETGAAVGHGLQFFVLAMAAGGARPLEFQSLEFLAKLDGAVAANVEGIVVKEDFLHLREVFESLGDFADDVVDGAGAPGVAG